MPAWWITKWSVRAWADATASRYLVLDYSVTGGTFAYLVSLAFAAAILIALLPIARVLQLAVTETLKGDARAASRSGGAANISPHRWWPARWPSPSSFFVGAGVLVRSFANVVGADLGVRGAEQVMVGLVSLPSDKYPTPTSRAAFFSRLDTRLRTIAGSEAVSVASTFPTRSGRPRQLEIDGRRSPIEGDFAQVRDRRP